MKRVLKSYTIPSLLETFTLLKEESPHYTFHSEVYGIEMSAVPRDYISKHYLPEEKLKAIFRLPKPDRLQKVIIELVSLLSVRSGIPISEFGITGSVLLEIHNPEFSDIDLTVYGRENSALLKKTLREESIGRLEGKELKDWCKRKTERYPITLKEALIIYRRKWNIGKFEGVNFSLHPVKTEEELEEKYGDKIYRALGEVTIGATVSEDLDSMFLPAVYKVEDVDITRGEAIGDIKEVVSYESLYADIATEGERIKVRGKLEEVTEKKSGKVYYRVLVGSPQGKGREYIKPISDRVFS